MLYRGISLMAWEANLISSYIVITLCFAGSEDRRTEAVAASLQESSRHGDVGAREERLADATLGVDLPYRVLQREHGGVYMIYWLPDVCIQRYGQWFIQSASLFFFLQSSLCLMSDGYETRFTENDSKSLLLLNLVLVGVQRENSSIWNLSQWNQHSLNLLT